MFPCDTGGGHLSEGQGLYIALTGGAATKLSSSARGGRSWTWRAGRCRRTSCFTHAGVGPSSALGSGGAADARTSGGRGGGDGRRRRNHVRARRTTRASDGAHGWGGALGRSVGSKAGRGLREVAEIKLVHCGSKIAAFHSQGLYVVCGVRRFAPYSPVARLSAGAGTRGEPEEPRTRDGRGSPPGHARLSRRSAGGRDGPKAPAPARAPVGPVPILWALPQRSLTGSASTEWGGRTSALGPHVTADPVRPPLKAPARRLGPLGRVTGLHATPHYFPSRATPTFLAPGRDTSNLRNNCRPSAENFLLLPRQ